VSNGPNHTQILEKTVAWRCIGCGEDDRMRLISDLPQL